MSVQDGQCESLGHAVLTVYTRPWWAPWQRHRFVRCIHCPLRVLLPRW